MAITMTKLTSMDSWRTPYDMEAYGFNPDWWLSGTFDSVYDDWWTFGLDGAEVARALINGGSTINDAYEGITPPSEVKDIMFFEVRAQYRRKGVGREVVQMLVDHYEGEVLTAFSAGADFFWGNVGFVLCPRKDGKDIDGAFRRSYDPLFVYDGRTIR